MSMVGIPEDVRRFLLEHIESYEQLEVLIHLRKQPDRSSSSEAIASASSIPLAAVEAALEDLREAGLAEVSSRGAAPEWRYVALQPDVDATIVRLSQAYEENAIDIVKLMNANAIERVRTSAIRAFANAFIVGRSKKRG
jgi:hypothetical protein